jgi:DNA mismatch endonuclease (patch repair protein)
MGLRYRIGTRIEGAKPDIAFLRRRVLVFVDGCFWHGCPWHFTMPVQNASFWSAKIEKNRARDVRNNQTLEACGWRVLRFWECEVEKGLDGVVNRVRSYLLA